PGVPAAPVPDPRHRPPWSPHSLHRARPLTGGLGRHGPAVEGGSAEPPNPGVRGGGPLAGRLARPRPRAAHPRQRAHAGRGARLARRGACDPLGVHALVPGDRRPAPPSVLGHDDRRRLRAPPYLPPLDPLSERRPVGGNPGPDLRRRGAGRGARSPHPSALTAGDLTRATTRLGSASARDAGSRAGQARADRSGIAPPPRARTPSQTSGMTSSIRRSS